MVQNNNRRSTLKRTDYTTALTTTMVIRPNQLMTVHQEDSTRSCTSIVEAKEQAQHSSKHVSFTNASPVMIEAQAHPDSFNNWYSKPDYQSFKAEFVAQAKRVARSNRSSAKNTSNSCGNAILKTFQDCCDSSTTNNNNNSPSSCLSKMMMAQQQDDVIIGLERMAARKIAMDKAKRRNELVSAIYNQQQQHTNNANDDEALRAVCERISRPSRLFALRLAQAAAKAA